MKPSCVESILRLTVTDLKERLIDGHISPLFLIADKEHVGWHDDKGDGTSISPRGCLPGEHHVSPYAVSKWDKGYKDIDKDDKY